MASPGAVRSKPVVILSAAKDDNWRVGLALTLDGLASSFVAGYGRGLPPPWFKSAALVQYVLALAWFNSLALVQKRRPGLVRASAAPVH